MPPREPRSKKPVPPPSGVLDWTQGHWGGRLLKCRYCPGLTNLRDSKGSPAHKVCAEKAIAEQVADYAAAYENERLPTDDTSAD